MVLPGAYGVVRTAAAPLLYHPQVSDRASTGISISPLATIGPGLYINHFGSNFVVGGSLAQIISYQSRFDFVLYKTMDEDPARLANLARKIN
ncbi:MAG: hypothetical protein GC204_08135 [Chloroflexi bacterium]|nr:hypothetical protein [Chloroflexota bacterium]